jgi:hypothetical protein
MARVFVDPDTAQWVHADTGNRIGTWEVRNQEPHHSEILRRCGNTGINTKYGNSERIAGDYTLPGTIDPGQRTGQTPIVPENFTAVEEQYVEELLAQANYA